VLVLVADDDTTCRHVAAAVVQNLGHDCLAAHDGSEAWDLLQQRPVDVLITDWMMPGLDGPELCRRVRDQAHGYTYIIMVTSLTERDHVVAAMEAGADDYLTKPLDAFDVKTRLIAATRVTSLHRQLHEFGTELERLNAQFAVQARTDPLTGLGNRLALHEDLAEFHTRAARSAKPYGAALCDIDFFKRYNDTHGHLDGDDVLRRVAGAIAGNCRSVDRAYRYGGEEFLVLLDDTLAGGEIAAERCRQAVEDLAIPHAGNQPSGVVTISVGVAVWDGASPIDGTGVVKQADVALYEAKGLGRNQVVGPLSRAPRTEPVAAGLGDATRPLAPRR
jgi:diguanylate cyclase (GGDEF)-like protein